MIALQKEAIPPMLQANAAAWTAELINTINDGEEPTKTQRSRYNQPEIKEALVAETHGKCAYCESKLLHIAYGDIEHITPKSKDNQVWYQWDNLTLACDRCNTNKGNYLDVIDPYNVDPEQHLWFQGAMVFQHPGSDEGALTERRLQLNRDDLLERRAERLKGLMVLLDRIERVINPAVKIALQTDFLLETEPAAEFAAMARAVARAAQQKGLIP